MTPHTGCNWWLFQSNGALIQLSESSSTVSPVGRPLYTLSLDMHLLEPSLYFPVSAVSHPSLAHLMEHMTVVNML